MPKALWDANLPIIRLSWVELYRSAVSVELVCVDLFSSQCLDGIDSGGADCWQQRCHARDYCECSYGSDEYPGIADGCAVEEAAESAGDDESNAETAK